MRYFINSVSGFILGLAPLLISFLFAILIYNSYPNVYGILLSIPVILFGLYLGWKVFKKVQIVGFIEFISINRSTPDLDNIEPVNSSSYRKIEPSEYSKLTTDNKLWCTSGAIRIYGDWLEHYPDNVYTIKSVDFDLDKQILLVSLENNIEVEIQKPGSLRETTTYLKIKHAKAVKVTWKNKDNMGQDYFLSYMRKEKEIKHSTNVNWFKPYYDVSAFDEALVLYGKSSS